MNAFDDRKQTESTDNIGQQINIFKATMISTGQNKSNPHPFHFGELILFYLLII